MQSKAPAHKIIVQKLYKYWFGMRNVGGQKIIRCELSLDDGESWLLADIRRIQEKENQGGKWWAWVHWDIEVPTGKLDFLSLEITFMWANYIYDCFQMTNSTHVRCSAW